ncbi:MAG: complex I NDUFA9 subunit family protein [Gammaproteobacteria bacterium]|nr:complex I NDUFA9 subunit family protein [Gammaproteobacteria bacterium]
MTRRICLLGGTGFIGGHLTTRLANDGWRVRLLTRSAARHKELSVLPTVRLLSGNVYDANFLARHIDGCDAVVNLVGILNESGRDGSGFERAHVELAGKVVAACQQTGVSRLLHMSALKADADNGPSHYLRSKGKAEVLVRRAQGMNVTAFQPSVVFGPDDTFVNRFAGLLRLPSPIFPLPRANSRFQPVYVGDVVDAFVTALDDPETYGKVYQLCGPDVYSLRELIELIAKSMGVRRRVVAVPDGIARIQAFFMDFVPTKPFSTDNFQSLAVNSICDKNGFERLGLQPHSSRALIPRMLRHDSWRGRLDTYRSRHGQP